MLPFSCILMVLMHFKARSADLQSLQPEDQNCWQTKRAEVRYPLLIPKVLTPDLFHLDIYLGILNSYRFSIYCWTWGVLVGCFGFGGFFPNISLQTHHLCSLTRHTAVMTKFNVGILSHQYLQGIEMHEILDWLSGAVGNYKNSS